MRGFNKLLFRDKWHVFPFFFKNRILNFKRTKWKIVKSRVIYVLKHSKKYLKHLFFVRMLKFKRCVKYFLYFIKRKKTVKRVNKRKLAKFFKKIKSILKVRKFKKLNYRLRRRRARYKRDPFRQGKYSKTFLGSLFFPASKILLPTYDIKKRFMYKTLLIAKATVLKYYYGCLSAKTFKRLATSKNYKKHLAMTFITPELRLDILLWRLKFFSSPYLAKFAFHNDLVLINGLKPAHKLLLNRFLKGGDILSISPSTCYNYKKNLGLVVSSVYLPTFIELDYYTNIIILLKDLELSARDFNSILKEPLNFYHFKHFLTKSI